MVNVTQTARLIMPEKNGPRDPGSGTATPVGGAEKPVPKEQPPKVADFLGGSAQQRQPLGKSAPPQGDTIAAPTPRPSISDGEDEPNFVEVTQKAKEIARCFQQNEYGMAHFLLAISFLKGGSKTLDVLNMPIDVVRGACINEILKLGFSAPTGEPQQSRGIEDVSRTAQRRLQDTRRKLTLRDILAELKQAPHIGEYGHLYSNEDPSNALIETRANIKAVRNQLVEQTTALASLQKKIEAIERAVVASASQPQPEGLLKRVSDFAATYATNHDEVFKRVHHNKTMSNILVGISVLIVALILLAIFMAARTWK